MRRSFTTVNAKTRVAHLFYFTGHQLVEEFATSLTKELKAVRCKGG